MNSEEKSILEEIIERGDTDPERLHPDLKACLEPGPMGTWVRHPLVIEMPPILVELANLRYEKRREAVRKAEQRGDRLAVLMLHERPFRFAKLFEWYVDGNVAREKFRELLCWTWMDTEKPHINRRYALEMIAAARDNEPLTDSEDSLPFMDKQRFAIYRGTDEKEAAAGTKDRRQYGISWTLDREKALWFAKRYRQRTGGGVLLTTSVGPKDVLAYFEGHDEAEVIIEPEGTRSAITRESIRTDATNNQQNSEQNVTAEGTL